MTGPVAGASADAYWLTLTNLGLGIVVLVCVLVIAAGVVHDLARRRRERAALSRELDRDLRELVSAYEADPRLFHDAALGPTMADGGEPSADGRDTGRR